MNFKEIIVYVLLGIIVLQIIFVIFVAPFFKKKHHQKLIEQQKELIKQIKIGHEILLNSGIYGKISQIEELTFIVEIAPQTHIKINKDAVLGFFDSKIANQIQKQKRKTND